jgi:stage III sporulation protein AA
MNVGLRTDVLDNCPKAEGIMMAIRSMSPEIIICDEIGTHKDMESILMALNSGVSLITSIHGYGIEDLYNRAVFKEIIDNHVFKRAVIVSARKGAGTIEYIYDFDKKDKLWRNQND